MADLVCSFMTSAALSGIGMKGIEEAFGTVVKPDGGIEEAFGTDVKPAEPDGPLSHLVWYQDHRHAHLDEPSRSLLSAFPDK